MGMISIIIIIVATGSRGNMISILFMSIVYFLSSYKKLFMGLIFLPFTFILSPVITTISQLFSNSENLKLEELFSLFTVLNNMFSQETSDGNSIDQRKNLIVNGITAFLKTYGLGLGGGGARALEEEMGGVAGNITSMHNFWIEILVEGGVLFVVCFIVWYIYIIYLLHRISLKTRNENLKYFSSSASLSMIGFLVGATSPSSCIYLFPMWILLGFAVATINNYHLLNKNL